MLLYSISCLLDAVDGQAARYYDQCNTATNDVLSRDTRKRLFDGLTLCRKTNALLYLV